MLRVIIDRAALDRGEPAIQVVSEDDSRVNFREVWLPMGGTVIQGGPLQDGSRVWIEAQEVSGE